MEDEKNKSKMQIYKELRNEELFDSIGKIIVKVILGGIFAYIGYQYCKDNNYDTMKGIIFGILFPFVLFFIDEKYSFGIIFFIIFIFIWIIVCGYIPTWIGVLSILGIIIWYIHEIFEICSKDRTQEVDNIYNRKNVKVIQREKSSLPAKNINIDYKENELKAPEEEYYCEVCFKRISEEEYELYDCMCEECFLDVHLDENGEYHDDEFL